MMRKDHSPEPTGLSENSSDADSLASFEDDRSLSTGIMPGSSDLAEESTPIAKKEMYAVLCSKVTVYIVLLLAAASVGTITWFLTTNDEISSFKGEVSE
jgi:hypothetical protein